MAEDLHDGEFWLPSHFLTDDDILMDFDFSTTSTTVTATTHGGSSSISDFDFSSVAESDEDDLLNLHHLSLHHSSCPLHFKGYGGGVLSSSPQSTLYGCLCNQSSSRESVSPPPPQAEGKNTTATAGATGGEDNSTLNLLNKAAGEVARLKLMTENKKNKKIGTGFFDCSQKRVSYPPIKNPPMYFQPQFLHFPPMVWPPVQYSKFNQQKQQQQQQNKATKSENKSNPTNNSNNNNNKNNSNRPLGLPLSAWPPLQAQAQPQPQPQSQSQAQPKQLQPLIVGPPKGTGVFLPRRVVTTPPANETRKKSDGNTAKSKTGKGSQSQPNNHRRNSGKTPAMTTTITTTTMMTTNHNDIQLPQEWIY